jgi:hypothetical protein
MVIVQIIRSTEQNYDDASVMNRGHFEVGTET